MRHLAPARRFAQLPAVAPRSPRLLSVQLLRDLPDPPSGHGRRRRDPRVRPPLRERGAHELVAFGAVLGEATKRPRASGARLAKLVGGHRATPPSLAATMICAMSMASWRMQSA